jgi:hypothetical protein
MQVQEILSDSANLIDQMVEIEGVLKIVPSQSQVMIYIRDFEAKDGKDGIELIQPISVLNRIFFPLHIFMLRHDSQEYETPVNVVGTLAQAASDKFSLSLDNIREVSLNVEYDEICKIVLGKEIYNFRASVEDGEFEQIWGTSKARVHYTYQLDIKAPATTELSFPISVREALESIQVNEGRRVMLNGFLSTYAPQIPPPEDWKTNKEAHAAYLRKINTDTGLCVKHEKYNALQLDEIILSECVVVDWHIFYLLIYSVVPHRVPVPYMNNVEITGKLGYSKIQPFLVAITDLETIIVRNQSYVY